MDPSLMENETSLMRGLTWEEAKKLQAQYGKNELGKKKRGGIALKTLHVITEPMFLLLIAAAVIYFILGEARDGIVMLAFVIGIIAIDVIQEWKTDKTLNALKELSAPKIKVIRGGSEAMIASADLVPGDLMVVEEGVKIPADGIVARSNDLSVDESTLTGEAESVWKSPQAPQSDGYWRSDYLYAGTLVTHGSGHIKVEKIGQSTEYGKIGAKVAEAAEGKTLLQKQTDSLVKTCAIIALALFMLVCIATWLNIPDHSFKERLIESVLSGITVAMAMIPEEFPVVLTVFLSMGAWRLAKQQSLVRKLPCVETLGAVSVLCVDKTGTITKNQMEVSDVWAKGTSVQALCEIMGLACETDPYDPMEKAMLKYLESQSMSAKELFDGELIFEYSFTNELKMMGHAWRKGPETIIAAKGSPESILSICRLSKAERQASSEMLGKMSDKGLRVIAVAYSKQYEEGALPSNLESCQLELSGFVGLSDPVREEVKNDMAECVSAGIRVAMITGDSAQTASSIAGEISMPNSDNIISGKMIDEMSDKELRESVKSSSIFSRVIPEHKMRIVKAFKENGDTVAMTGDGVNDAPALKYADIGISMGKRGSEVSREASDLILLDDNFTTIVNTIKDGRRIYDNIKKAVSYIFAIHIPIALGSLIAPALGIDPECLFLLPMHVVLLELLIDPTCSIVLERQPAEADIMKRDPRGASESLVSAKGLMKSIFQGLAIFIASFGAYYWQLANTGDAPMARSLGLCVLVFANLLLVQSNSSEVSSIVYSAKRLAKDKVMWAANIIALLAFLSIIYTPINGMLKLAPLPLAGLLSGLGLACISVLWHEALKFFKRLAKSQNQTAASL